MRFPTQNHSRSDEHSDHDDHDDGAASYAGDAHAVIPESAKKTPLEPWQSAFVLGPNVRFTRTPESVIARRREAEAEAERLAAEQAATAALQASLAQQRAQNAPAAAPSPSGVFASSAPTNSFGLPKTGSPLIVPRRNPPPRPVEPKPAEVVAETAAVEEVATTVVTIAPQFSPIVSEGVDQPLAEAIVTPEALEATRLRQAAAAMRMPEDIAVHMRADEAATPSTLAVEVQPALTIHAQREENVAFASGKLAVSDFAFFEMMSFGDEEGVVASVAVPEPYVPVSKPIGMPLYGSVAAFYREIKLKRVPNAKDMQPTVPLQFHTSASIYPPLVLPVIAATVEVVATPEPVIEQVEAVVVVEAEPVAAIVEAPVAPQPVEPQPIKIMPEIFEPAPAAIVPVRTFTESPRANRAIGGLEMNRNHPFDGDYVFPSIGVLQEPPAARAEAMLPEALEQSAGLLESVLEDFGIRGEVIDVRPGPVVT
ncbi:DNA translocase FtsK, partial [Rhizobium sp.]|uniref:DNA translocase FtsK n=1 Tax=Rhizobium sp. TaxID=391 RepID=UPI000E93FBBD|nr:DNA translocase FtsK [Rhizobium sp.]